LRVVDQGDDPLSNTPLAPHRPAELDGDTFAIAVTPPKKRKKKRSKQVILHQRGLFLITLGADRLVRAELDGVVVESQPISDEECHSIVFTADFKAQPVTKCGAALSDLGPHVIRPQ
jgi:hypothetical protein